MATASGEGKGTRGPVMPLVAYAVVLALLGLAGVALWAARGGPPDVPGSDRASPAISKAAPTEPVPAARGLKLSQSEASKSDPAASAAERSEPQKTTCTIDVGPWPTDRTDQAKAIQILLRDLGFYSGTTYGTVGPATREAIRKFQLAAHEADTGEPSEVLFESLKKKCASSVP
jgi:putative peptidoglycan binding protein